MSDDLSAENSSGVSPARKAVSAIVLVVLLFVLGIEIRAGLGQMWSAQTLEATAPGGAFPYQEFSYDSTQSLLSLFPSEEVQRESETEIEYKYSWYSLLRPLLNKPESVEYIVYSKSHEERWALFHSTEKMSDAEKELAAAAEQAHQDAEGDPESLDMTDFGSGPPNGSGNPFDDSLNGNGPRPGGAPPLDATVLLIDKDSDGELSEEELSAAAESLLAGDTNGDGKLSGDEIRPKPSENDGTSERRRPPLDDE